MARACGFEVVAARYEDELQSDVLIIGDDTATDDELSCLAKKRNSGYILVFDDEELWASYYAAERRIYYPLAKAASRDWLTKRGIADEIPDFATSGLNDVAFARKIETTCGPDADGALVGTASPHQLNDDFLDQAWDNDKKKAAFECILHVATVSGFELGFVGNEALP